MERLIGEWENMEGKQATGLEMLRLREALSVALSGKLSGKPTLSAGNSSSTRGRPLSMPSR